MSLHIKESYLTYLKQVRYRNFEIKGTTDKTAVKTKTNPKLYLTKKPKEVTYNQ